MNSKISFYHLVCCLILSLLCSCEKEHEEKYGMDAIIGTDKVWRAENDSIDATYKIGSAGEEIRYDFKLYATGLDKSVIKIIILKQLKVNQTYDAGYYPMFDGPAYIYYTEYRPDIINNYEFRAGDSSCWGQLTITKLDSINKVVSGVFSMRGRRQSDLGAVDYIEIKNGSLNNVNYQ